MKDNLDLFNEHEAEQQAFSEHLPVCDICGEHIYDEYCYQINGTVICESCMAEYYRKETAELVRE